MLGPALLAFLAVFVSFGFNWLVGQCMTERPIVVGLIAGIIFGNVPAGVMIGAALEAIFMGAVNVGGAVSAEPVTATVLAVCFVVVMGMDQGVAIALAVPIGLLAGVLYLLIFNVLMSVWAPAIDRAAASGEERNIALVHYLGWFTKYIILSLPAFFGVLLGAEPVGALVNQIPANVIAGFTTCGNLLPAVGMALLLKMLWNDKLAVYFILGFVLVIYLQLPMVAVAAIGAVIVVVTVQRDKELFDLKRRDAAVAAGGSPSGSASSDEEEFFA